ncbi:hypothetical protein SKAU_G00253980 [Synaphobranchus kaupii]|uniref:Uncharacterized protein n=1 Tax=Synaphobranchus kaupii TaxID=118154 RepID=A0A9Q1F3F2_SYNKA|nr:hypothetical protein SKAU_G00253980 [Synaphobranchus kaupii]
MELKPVSPTEGVQVHTGERGTLFFTVLENAQPVQGRTFWKMLGSALADVTTVPLDDRAQALKQNHAGGAAHPGPVPDAPPPPTSFSVPLQQGQPMTQFPRFTLALPPHPNTPLCPLFLPSETRLDPGVAV